MRKAVLTVLMAVLGLGAQVPAYLVLQKGASSLAYYSSDGKLITAIPVGQHPHEMVFSTDGKLLYTCDNGTMRIEHAGAGGNSLSVIDVAARKRVAGIPLGNFRRPHGIDIDPATGRLVVSTELPDQLLLIDPVQRKVLRTYETKGKTSHMVKLGPGAKFAYVSNSNSANVSVINIATGEVKLLLSGQRPEGSALARDGRSVYVCNRESASISIIDTATNNKTGEIATSRGPVRIEVAPDGMLVYAAMHDRRVAFADPKTKKEIASVALSGTPVSLHLSHDGKYAFASGEDQDTVFVVSIAERKVVKEFKTAKGAGPDPVFEFRSK